MKKFIKKLNMSACAIALICIITAWVYAVPSYAYDCASGDHDYEVTVVQKATEDTPGIRQYTCQICGYSYTEEIPATGHQWSDWITDVEPGPETPGHRYRVCTRHPENPHYEEEEIPPTGIIETTPPETTTPAETTTAEETSSRAETTEASTEETTEQTQEETSTPETIKQEETTAVATDTTEDEGSFWDFLGGPVNVADVALTTATAGIVWWYIVLLWPLILVLIWAKKKRDEARERQRREEAEIEAQLEEFRQSGIQNHRVT